MSKLTNSINSENYSTYDSYEFNTPSSSGIITLPSPHSTMEKTFNHPLNHPFNHPLNHPSKQEERG